MRWTVDAADTVRLRLLRLGRGGRSALSERRRGARPQPSDGRYLAGVWRRPDRADGHRRAQPTLAAGDRRHPSGIARWSGASGVSELVVVDTMHDRKRVMAERADAFAVLPGGIGTLDEFFEILTWRQLGLHDKPIFLVDVAGYWRPLRALLAHIVEQRFAMSLIPRLMEIVPNVTALMTALGQAAPGRKTRSDLL